MSADPQSTAGAASGTVRVEDAAREVSAFQSAILECADYAIISATPDGVIRTFNRAAERMLGYRAEEVVGKATPEIIHDREEVARRAAELSVELGHPVPAGFETFVAKARLGVADEQDWTYLRKDGSRFPVQLSVTAMRDTAGEITGFMGIAHDITRRQTAQACVRQLTESLEQRVQERTAQLAASERRFRHVVEASPSGVIMVDAAGRIVLVNEQAERLFGYPRAELLGQPVDLLVPEHARQGHAGQRALFMAKPGTRPMGAGRELFARRKDGREFPVEIGLNPIETGEGVMVLGTIVDISERKRAARVTATLAELGRQLGAANSRREAALVILAALDQLFEFDAMMLHLLTEDRRQRVFRVLLIDTVDGKRVEQPGEDAALEPSAMFRQVASEGARLILHDSSGPPDAALEAFGDKARRSASLMFVPIRAGGRVIGVLSVQSYTPRAFDAASLELLQSLADYAGTGLARVGAHDESERLSRLLLETQRVAHLGCFEGNLLTGTDHWSDETYRQMGYAPGEVVANLPNFLLRVHPEDRERVARGIEQIMRDGQPYESEYRLVQPDGTVRQIHSAVAAEVNAAGRVVRVYGAAQDVTHQKQTESELRQSQAELEHRVRERTAELARLNMLLHSEVEDRKAMEAELRSREEQLRDLFENATDLIQSVTPDGHILFVNRAWLNTLGYRIGELSALTVFDIIHPDSLADCREHFARVMQGVPVSNLQAAFRAKDGRKIHVEGSASCRFENGKPVATRAIFRDISKRKAVEAERERLITELQAALAEVKTLSGLLPVCGWCKKIRDDSGYWNSVEGYLKKSSGVDITHGICPECAAKMMADVDRIASAPQDKPSAS